MGTFRSFSLSEHVQAMPHLVLPSVSSSHALVGVADELCFRLCARRFTLEYKVQFYYALAH